MFIRHSEIMLAKYSKIIFLLAESGVKLKSYLTAQKTHFASLSFCAHDCKNIFSYVFKN